MTCKHRDLRDRAETLTMVDVDLKPPTTIAWALALGLATVVGTLATACMTPFVALAVMADSTMPPGRALLTVVAVWLTNQVLGFTIEHYPLTPLPSPGERSWALRRRRWRSWRTG